ncbi:MAG TPA: carbon starvation protein A [Candidatus Polarisedimenticolia bacterium]|nr:carbon starvation protein A [Candidatus Polarisedimenticolia bacterium]
MSPVVVTLLCFGVYLAAYFLYAKFLARRVFHLDRSAVTPAHALEDGVDYVPTNRYVLFGHHYASIAGLSPMLGPAIAVMWGWLPALLWVVLGTALIGAVHDFSALVVSMRARGMSIGRVAEDIMGRRAKTLFHIIIFFLVALAMGVFVFVVATLFTDAYHPEAVGPTFALMVLAVIMGWLIYRRGVPILPLTLACFVIMLVLVWFGMEHPFHGLGVGGWSLILLAYAFLASVLPVWLLLQPRDFINSLLLYLGMILMFGGFFLLRPTFQAPAFEAHPAGAPPFFPFVFITIACGAISGFHALVSSGTTAKQIDRETDAPLIGYGGMIGESLLGLIAVLATTAGFASAVAWHDHYRNWAVASRLSENLGAFIDGAGLFIQQFGVPQGVARSFVTVVAVSFALTSLDTAARLLRYNISEIGETLRVRALGDRYLASTLAIGAIGFFAFFRIDGRPAGLALWQLFGTTNQILGGLTLLAVTLYLAQRGWPARYTLVPMLFMMVTTLWAMAAKIRDFSHAWLGDRAVGNLLLLLMGLLVLGLSLWLAVEAALRMARHRRGPLPGMALERETD